MLEGGYAIRGALPYVNLGICLALAGLDAARNAGFRGTKLNAVLLGGINADEIPALAQLAQDGKYEVRFIELMPIGECADWPRERFLSADAVLHAMPELQRLPNEGVAELYRMPGWKGKIGLIRPMSHRFCADCDRIRVTADGRLKPCLHSAQEIPLQALTNTHCRFCRSCEKLCPWQAITIVEEEGRAVLAHHDVLCARCGLCLDICPEHGLHWDRGLTVENITAPHWRVLAEGAARECERCGEIFYTTEEGQIRCAVCRNKY